MNFVDFDECFQLDAKEQFSFAVPYASLISNLALDSVLWLFRALVLLIFCLLKTAMKL